MTLCLHPLADIRTKLKLILWREFRTFINSCCTPPSAEPAVPDWVATVVGSASPLMTEGSAPAAGERAYSYQFDVWESYILSTDTLEELPKVWAGKPWFAGIVHHRNAKPG